jgi:hypothetical protein
MSSIAFADTGLCYSPVAGCLRLPAQRIESRRRQRAPDVETPGFPALAVAPVFQSAGRNAVQVEQVSRIVEGA